MSQQAGQLAHDEWLAATHDQTVRADDLHGPGGGRPRHGRRQSEFTENHRGGTLPRIPRLGQPAVQCGRDKTLAVGELCAVEAALMETRNDLRALGQCVVVLSSSRTLSMGHALNIPEGRHRVEMYPAYRLRLIC
jgi:hypothetical protein